MISTTGVDPEKLILMNIKIQFTEGGLTLNDETSFVETENLLSLEGYRKAYNALVDMFPSIGQVLTDEASVNIMSEFNK
jgi:hypothetical protein